MLGVGKKLLTGKRGTAALIGGAFMAGIGSKDPVDHGIREFERSVMGDPNHSERILGRPLGGYGLIAGITPIPDPIYMNTTALANAASYRRFRSGDMQAPGSMVFGMFNSRMG